MKDIASGFHKRTSNSHIYCGWVLIQYLANRQDESKRGGNIERSGVVRSESVESRSAGDAEGEVGREGEGEGVGMEEGVGEMV